MRLFIFIIIPSFAFAGIVKNEVYLQSEKKFSFKEVCHKMVGKNTPLIEKISQSLIDCMGKKISARKFCEETFKDNPYFARGFVEKNSKLVNCQLATKVLVKYQCKKKDDNYCEESDLGCEGLKTYLAVNLKTTYHSFLTNPTGEKFLSCYFEANNSNKL